MEENTSESFMNKSKEVAKHFLHTVVFLDDQAAFEEAEQPDDGIKKPEKTGKQEDGELSPDPKESAHKLDAKKVMDVFAYEGIVCSVLKPSETDDPLEITINAAKRADVLVLDWQLNKDDGIKSIEIIKKVIDSDSKEDPRLRLIIVYTGENNLTNIAERLKEETNIQNEDLTEDLTLSSGHLNIVVFAKEGVNVSEEQKDRVLKTEDLPEKVISEFAKITAGLVSNVALESMSVLRDNTHLILGRFGPEMDPPYLAHRALLPNSYDAIEYIVDIVSSEFYSILENYDVGNKADLDSIRSWLSEYNPEENFTIGDPTNPKEVNLETILDFLGKNFDVVCKENEIKNKAYKNAWKNFTKVFCFNNQDPQELNYKFTILTTQKYRSGMTQPLPILTQGTILKNLADRDSEDSENFWLCIQPRCDCVNIKDQNRSFLFLSMKKIDDNNKFDLVVEDDEDHVNLEIVYTTYKTKLYEFQKNNSTDSVIRAKDKNDHFVFITAGKENNICFKWVSELRSEYAQRIANNFSAHISRVGLDEFEWLRRNAQLRNQREHRT
ncbi:MAG: response regulator receiver domain [Halobacteriota archaeon]|nr:response regulator receiver domain [Halobacteriota archaeon]